MGSQTLSVALLTKYQGKDISDICGNGLTSSSSNHCAHFVNHVMSQDHGYTCKKATGEKNAAANVRVHETFKRCPKVGKWADRGTIKKCFVFITYASSVKLRTKKMSNRPNKHIGIYCDGNIWHYSNSKNKVVKQTPTQFAKHYSGDKFALFYGTFPTDVDPVDPG